MNTVNAIRQYHEQKKTGTLMITVNHKAICLNLNNGEICYVFFSGQKNSAALPLLKSELARGTDEPRIIFNEAPVTPANSDLPDTASILSELSSLATATAAAPRQVCAAGK